MRGKSASENNCEECCTGVLCCTGGSTYLIFILKSKPLDHDSVSDVLFVYDWSIISSVRAVNGRDLGPDIKSSFTIGSFTASC